MLHVSLEHQKKGFGPACLESSGGVRYVVNPSSHLDNYLILREAAFQTQRRGASLIRTPFSRGHQC